MRHASGTAGLDDISPVDYTRIASLGYKPTRTHHRRTHVQLNHVRISLISELIDDDIKTYVDERVESSDNLKALVTEDMKKKLRIKADGV
jgi:hypothetical protein